MKNLFVPYELAVKAREKGFGGRCVAYQIHWMNEPLITFSDNNINSQFEEHLFAIPLYQQLLDWFDKEHGLIFIPTHRMNGDIKNYWYSISKFEKSSAGVAGGVVGMIDIGAHLTNELALNAAFLKAFDLI